MASKNSKTNRTGRVFTTQKTHFCPTCDAPAKLVMRMPGRTMFGNCENGHQHRKGALILR